MKPDDYEVVVTREDDSWLADVPAIAGAHTFARSLPALRQAVREVVILMADLPGDADVGLRFIYDRRLPKAVRSAAALAAKREEALRREEELIASTAEVARELTASGYTVRDTAALLGITAGRVSQLTGRRAS